MNWQVIGSLVRKDLTLFTRDRFFALITVLGLVFYIGIYLVMPRDVDETLEFGLVVEGGELPTELANGLHAQQGVELTTLDSREALEEAVLDGDFVAGVVLEGTFSMQATADTPPVLTILFPPGVPESLQNSVTVVFDQMGAAMSGGINNVTLQQEIIGVDRVGNQIPLRDRMLPIFAVLILLVESMSLASLITEEVETRTVRALLITPMNITGLFVSKAIVGVGLAFTQAFILMAITGGLSNQPLLVMLVLLLGSLLVTGLAFLIASFAKDTMSVISWSVLLLLILTVPAVTTLFPGTTSDWMQLIPSYYLVDAVSQIINFNAGFADIANNLLVLLVVSGAALVLGATILRRKLVL